MGRAIVGIFIETLQNFPNPPLVHVNRRVESTPTTSYTSIILRTTPIRTLMRISYWILDTDVLSCKMTPSFLLKSHRHVFDAGDRFPHKNNGIHSTGYYAGGIFHTQTTLPLLTFCSTGCINVHTRGNISQLCHKTWWNTKVPVM